MTDEEKIEQAANAVAGAHEDADRYYTFLAAVQWRDENPSPKTVAYIKCAETMIKLQQCPMDDTETWHKIMTEGSEAVRSLRKWEKK